MWAQTARENVSARRDIPFHMTDGDDSEPPALESPNNARDAAAATAKSAGNEVTPSISIKRGLYVGDINASFDKLRDDYVINITVWADVAPAN
jgi:hypothetical protein